MFGATAGSMAGNAIYDAVTKEEPKPVQQPEQQ